MLPLGQARVGSRANKPKPGLKGAHGLVGDKDTQNYHAYFWCERECQEGGIPLSGEVLSSAGPGSQARVGN